MRSGDEVLELRAWGWEFRVKGLELWLEFLEVTVQGYFCRVFMLRSAASGANLKHSTVDNLTINPEQENFKRCTEPVVPK